MELGLIDDCILVGCLAMMGHMKTLNRLEIIWNPLFFADFRGSQVPKPLLALAFQQPTINLSGAHGCS